jgi:hypothetical protein
VAGIACFSEVFRVFVGRFACFSLDCRAILRVFRVFWEKELSDRTKHMRIISMTTPTLPHPRQTHFNHIPVFSRFDKNTYWNTASLICWVESRFDSIGILLSNYFSSYENSLALIFQTSLQFLALCLLSWVNTVKRGCSEKKELSDIWPPPRYPRQTHFIITSLFFRGLTKILIETLHL